MRFKCICPIFLTANVIQIHSHFKKKKQTKHQNNQANKTKPKKPRR